MIEYKEQTRQELGWMKAVDAYKSALSPWKKGEAKHRARVSAPDWPEGYSESEFVVEDEVEMA